MKITPISISNDLAAIEQVAKESFSNTLDASLSDWFSFGYMEQMIKEDRGLCLKAISDAGDIVGMIYAQQENPINGNEGIEKWVVILAGVKPENSGQGIGSQLLKELEKFVATKGVKKMFIFTNKYDGRVIHFYKKNGYEDAGWIKDYQYGKDNSAVFLLKYLT